MAILGSGGDLFSFLRSDGFYQEQSIAFLCFRILQIATDVVGFVAGILLLFYRRRLSIVLGFAFLLLDCLGEIAVIGHAIKDYLRPPDNFGPANIWLLFMLDHLSRSLQHLLINSGWIAYLLTAPRIRLRYCLGQSSRKSNATWRWWVFYGIAVGVPLWASASFYMLYRIDARFISIEEMRALMDAISFPLLLAPGRYVSYLLLTSYAVIGLLPLFWHRWRCIQIVITGLWSLFAIEMAFWLGKYFNILSGLPDLPRHVGAITGLGIAFSWTPYLLEASYAHDRFRGRRLNEKENNVEIF